jgi:hypothetical protein
MEISPLLLELITKEAAELGAITTLVKTGQCKPFLNKSEAFRLFGRANVEQWLEDGLIIKRKDGDHSAAWRLDRLELEVVARSVCLLKYDRQPG